MLPTKNGAAGARFWLTKCGGCLIWAEGMWLVRCTLELRGWEVGNERRMRVGENLAKNQYQAAGARFWLTKREGCSIWAERTWLVRGPLELRG